MVYKEYLNSARKHLFTCNVIFEKLEDKKPQIKAIKTSLLLNLYYLSGYIIECIVKWAIFELIAYPKDQDVKKLDKKDLSFNKNIRFHKFDRYTQHLIRLSSLSIPLIHSERDIKKEVVRLYREWDVDIRYSYDTKKYNDRDYIQFYEYAKKIYETLTIDFGVR